MTAAMLAALGVLSGPPTPGAPALGVPAALRVSPGETLLLRAHASGMQIYLCTAGTDGRPQWTLKAPEAELRDDRGKLIGHHGAGPSWTHADGSQVTGKAVARVDAPEADAVPWLLLEAVGHTGKGVLAGVTHVQRLNTHGGQPPPASQCDAAHQEAQARVPYTADYYFYARTAY
jgi:Protein of unknown function (DUF3455)